jgi:hypothetical protein
MKGIFRLGITALIVSCPFFSFAQCGSTLSMINYDTTVTGTGNDVYIFNVPKFDPSLGDLKEVQLNSQITSSYSFQIENRDTRFVANVRVRVNRVDNITNPDLGTPFTNTITKTTNPFNLGPKDVNTGSGADYHAEGPIDLLDNAQILKRGNNVAPFMGAGYITLTYSTNTSGTVTGSSLNTFLQSTTDVMHFSVTYLYCPTSSVLNQLIKTFKVTEKDGKAQVSWTSADDHGRRYEVQVNNIGKSFNTVYATTSEANATGNYLFRYPLTEAPSGKIIFRLKVINKDGSFYYTPEQVINVTKNVIAGMKLFPNPAHDEVQLTFDNTRRGSWEVSVLSITGQPVKEYSFKNVMTGILSLKGTLPKGTYLIQAVNTNTQMKQVARLIIQ